MGAMWESLSFQCVCYMLCVPWIVFVPACACGPTGRRDESAQGAPLIKFKFSVGTWGKALNVRLPINEKRVRLTVQGRLQQQWGNWMGVGLGWPSVCGSVWTHRSHLGAHQNSRTGAATIELWCGSFVMWTQSDLNLPSAHRATGLS